MCRDLIWFFNFSSKQTWINRSLLLSNVVSAHDSAIILLLDQYNVIKEEFSMMNFDEVVDDEDILRQ